MQGGYGVVNGSIGIKAPDGEGLKLTLFVNNLTKKRFATFIGDGSATFGNNHVLTQFLPRGARRYGGVKLDFAF